MRWGCKYAVGPQVRGGAAGTRWGRKYAVGSRGRGGAAGTRWGRGYAYNIVNANIIVVIGISFLRSITNAIHIDIINCICVELSIFYTNVAFTLGIRLLVTSLGSSTAIFASSLVTSCAKMGTSWQSTGNR